MNITIDGLDTVKQLPWIGDRIININYDFEEGELITRATHMNPDAYEDDYIYIRYVWTENYARYTITGLQNTQLEQYILDKYHS
jgi:hypothetical protein